MKCPLCELPAKKQLPQGVLYECGTIHTSGPVGMIDQGVACKRIAELLDDVKDLQATIDHCVEP